MPQQQQDRSKQQQQQDLKRRQQTRGDQRKGSQKDKDPSISGGRESEERFDDEETDKGSRRST